MAHRAWDLVKHTLEEFTTSPSTAGPARRLLRLLPTLQESPSLKDVVPSPGMFAVHLEVPGTNHAIAIEAVPATGAGGGDGDDLFAVSTVSLETPPAIRLPGLDEPGPPAADRAVVPFAQVLPAIKERLARLRR